ncbi:hypothetical protein SAMN05428937_2468 [Achromobacter sp. MFA1 R4]|nr:hypothetical protein SAMN05428937_2468 [Achromobacter sp. MFA1 R4]
MQFAIEPGAGTSNPHRMDVAFATGLMAISLVRVSSNT